MLSLKALTMKYGVPRTVSSSIILSGSVPKASTRLLAPKSASLTLPSLLISILPPYRIKRFWRNIYMRGVGQGMDKTLVDSSLWYRDEWYDGNVNNPTLLEFVMCTTSQQPMRMVRIFSAVTIQILQEPILGKCLKYCFEYPLQLPSIEQCSDDLVTSWDQFLFVTLEQLLFYFD